MSFQPIRQLLNPKFDGYKLSPVSEADAVASFQLPGLGISQSTVSPQSHLLFPEVQSRIRHNHLAVAQNEKSVCYIDKDGQVIVVTLDEVCSYQPVTPGRALTVHHSQRPPRLCSILYFVQTLTCLGV